MGRRVFFIQMKRAVCSARFLIACIGIGAIMYGNIYWFLVDGGENAISGWSVLRGMGSFIMTLAIFPLLPFSLSYADERNERVLPFWIVRIGIKSYMCEKFIVSVLSGMLAYMGGMLLYLLFACLQFPFHVGGSSAVDAYSEWLEQGKPFLYFFISVFHYSFSAAIFCGLAVCLSVYIPNRFAVIMLPILIYLLLVRIGEFNYFSWLRPGSLIESITDAGTPLLSLLVKIGISCLILLFFCCLTLEQAERRLKHE